MAWVLSHPPPGPWHTRGGHWC